ncbi:MAG: acyl-CoA dehydrogenase family protein [Acidimicrobiales bacterium]|jgi:alkylation response protein AidB-like acyl-CoA dehydrogenase|nr:acyl-CoA dehydrogenase [Acidimicrobiaceae bacterium]MDG2352259.1 acyl-CoA dehydrogenase family protein [Acidimicrobiales bacterium]MDP6161522.1 acyl-CoA dehydrogenase family protein [Acidimicrobiales bacterium]MDP6285291.1 acyl-CoA dehydrogenase family protein [Acidimicrobiales bacterium]HJL91331.1 acyl-CoA dehydrogenase family protein [Acidimicrobiales bacterium]|tara:strand:- start:13792 stop:15006 length:1215 start_codon:yes stop_codon:yes gene_type:complete
MDDFSMELNEDQLQLQEWVHQFSEDVIRPAAEEWDEREEFPFPVVEQAAEVGLYSWEFLANGMMGDKTGLTLPVAIEELFWGDAGIGMAIMGSGLAAAGILASGTQEQVLEWVPQCYGEAGDLKIGAFCASEPDAGSDVGGYRTKAVYDEATDEWVLNGTKAWITNGGLADIHVVVAVVEPELKSRGHASFIVPPNTPGLSQGQKYKKHGIKASHTAEVVLEDVRIPGSCLLGTKEKLDERIARVKEGKSGNAQAAMQTFEATRPAVAAQAIGVARAAYEYSLEYAKEREAFGRPIIMNQGIAFMLADMAVEIDAARWLTWRAAWLGTHQGFKNAEGSMAKLKAGRVATWVTERAIQILGGYGYVREYPVERWHRDAKIHDIFEGTEQIQQLVISRAISGLRIE